MVMPKRIVTSLAQMPSQSSSTQMEIFKSMRMKLLSNHLMMAVLLEIVRPGQFSVRIIPDNQDANITFPIEEHKSYLTWVDFEQQSPPFYLGFNRMETAVGHPPNKTTKPVNPNKHTKQIKLTSQTSNRPKK